MRQARTNAGAATCSTAEQVCASGVQASGSTLASMCGTGGEDGYGHQPAVAGSRLAAAHAAARMHSMELDV